MSFQELSYIIRPAVKIDFYSNTLENDTKMEKTVREVDLFIFDLDGTLADSKDDLKAAINHTLKSFGMKALTDQEIREVVGNGITRLFKNITGKTEEEKYETIRTYIEYLESHLLDTTVPYPGVIETLSGIAKRKALVTNKLVRMAERVVTAVEAFNRINRSAYSLSWASAGDVRLFSRRMPRRDPVPPRSLLR